ncbi:MAG: DUF4169 family protein [Pikeienuella sp.]
MSDKPINLRLARKATARDAARREADANAARHGRSKTERRAEEVEIRREVARLDGHRLEEE